MKMGGKTQHNKGVIKDNALKALVKSNIFRCKTERKKKGKGSYNRQAAKKWQDGFDNRPVLFSDGLAVLSVQMP